MIVATHQPIFLPWPGLFFKAIKADCLVLLDDVQFPRAGGWMNRNRLKGDRGELWLTVPVHRRGRGFQKIRDVQIFNAANWKKKHLFSIQQKYANAPYLSDYFPPLRDLYSSDHSGLLRLNLGVIRFFWEALGLKTELIVQSDLGVTGRGTDLIVNLCQRLGAGRYLSLQGASKYLDTGVLSRGGIELERLQFKSPVYPQLWGEFLANLSTLDLLLNCGPRGSDILEKS